MTSSFSIYPISVKSFGSIDVSVLIKSVTVSLFSPGFIESIISLVKLIFPLTRFMSLISFWYFFGKWVISFDPLDFAG